MAKEKTKLVAMRESAYDKIKEISDQTKVPLVELVSQAVELFVKAKK